MRIQPLIRLSGLAAFLLLGACAPTEPHEYRHRPDMAEVAKHVECRAGLTPMCTQRMNRPIACYCMDEDSMGMILEPDKY